MNEKFTSRFIHRLLPRRVSHPRFLFHSYVIEPVAKITKESAERLCLLIESLTYHELVQTQMWGRSPIRIYILLSENPRVYSYNSTTLRVAAGRIHAAEITRCFEKLYVYTCAYGVCACACNRARVYASICASI